MSEIRLYLKNPPAGIPQHLYANGVVEFDLPSGFDIQLSNAATKVTLDGFSEVVAIGFDLPDTSKNRLLLMQYSDIDWYSLDTSEGVGVVCQNGAYTLPQTVLKIKQYNKDVGFDCEIEYSNDDIMFGLQNTKLRDLMEQEFSITLFDLDDYYWNLSQYDGQSDICYPLVNFGRFYYIEDDAEKLTVHAVEFRPHLFAAAVFQKAFCGVRLEGTLLDSDFWNKQITYNLRRDYDRVLNEKRKFLSSVIPNAVIFPGGVPTDVFQLTETGSYLQLDLVVDGSLPETFGADWNNTTFKWGDNRHGVYGFEFNCIAVTDGVGGMVRIGIFKNGTLLQSNATATPYNNINVVVDVVEVLPSDVIEVKYTSVSASGIDAQYIYEVKFTNAPIRDCTPYEGELCRLRDFLDQDVTVFDYVKGISDALDLRYVLNRANATLGIYTNKAASIYGESVQMLMNNSGAFIDWTSKCNPDELTISYPQGTQSIKDITVAWKTATDAYITQVIKPEREFYSYYELVNGNAEREIKIENNLFEPTATANDFYWATNLQFMPWLPIMTDNNDASGNRNGQKSYELGHRIMLLVGGAIQSYPLASALVRFDFLSQLTADIIDTTAFSFATMYFDGTIDPSSVVYFTKNLTFDKGNANLYTELLKLGITAEKETPTFEMSIMLDRNDFFSFDFTSGVIVKSNGKPVNAQVILIDQFSLTRQQPTNVRLRKIIDVC